MIENFVTVFLDNLMLLGVWLTIASCFIALGIMKVTKLTVLVQEQGRRIRDIEQTQLDMAVDLYKDI